MISKTLVSQLLVLAASASPQIYGAQKSLDASAALPNLTLPWGTYQAQVFSEDNNVYLFQNVRFGVIPERFGAPAFPKSGNASVVHPPSEGRDCIQLNLEALNNSPFGKHPFNDPADQNSTHSEDCLFLDLYVPKRAFNEDSEPMPVVVWLYGGGYAFGSKSQQGPLYTGQSMLETTNYQTIFISGNYRVGAFGWLAGDYMQEVAQPNAGLHDQALLFEWVREHISKVNGNKRKVSAWGESAGAGSILHHLVREGGNKDPNFQTVALQSPAFQWSFDNKPGGQLDQIYEKFSQFAGCGSFNITCLRERDTKNLTAANQKLYQVSKAVGLFPVGPAVDGEWITNIPTLSFKNGDYWKDIDSTIVSHVLHEVVGPFIPKGADTPEGFERVLAEFMPGEEFSEQREAITMEYDCEERFEGNYTKCISAVIQDSTFTCNTRDVFQAFPDKTHMMRYGFLSAETAVHGSDLIPLFASTRKQTTDLAIKLSNNTLSWLQAQGFASLLRGTPNVAEGFQRYFAGFALTGDPNALLTRMTTRPTWPVADNSGDEFTNVLTVRSPLKKVWEGMDIYLPQNPFTLSQPDDQNSKSACGFWNDLAKEIAHIQGLPVRGPGKGPSDEL